MVEFLRAWKALAGVDDDTLRVTVKPFTPVGLT